MPDSPRRRALEYLRSHHVVTLATAGKQGVWAAAVFYASEGFELVFLSGERTRHARNIGAAGVIAATVQEDYRDWRGIMGVQLEGRVVRLEGEQRAAAIACYKRKFSFLRERVRTPTALSQAMKLVSWYRVMPSKVYFIDNSRGFGHRDQVLP